MRHIKSTLVFLSFISTKRQTVLSSKRQTVLSSKRQTVLSTKRQTDLSTKRQTVLCSKRQTVLSSKRQTVLSTKRQTVLSSKRQSLTVKSRLTDCVDSPTWRVVLIDKRVSCWSERGSIKQCARAEQAICRGQRNRRRPVHVPVTGVRYNSLLWMCTLNTLTWPDQKKPRVPDRGTGESQYLCPWQAYATTASSECAR